MSNSTVLDREFLEIRSRILDIAASLDRVQRMDPNPNEDERRQRIAKALEIVLSDSTDRAEQVQLLFSRAFDENWRTSFGS